jgi:uncharacterized membrane protein
LEKLVKYRFRALPPPPGMSDINIDAAEAGLFHPAARYLTAIKRRARQRRYLRRRGERNRRAGRLSMRRTVSERRSIAKAISYRLVIMALDFITIYLFTGAPHVALGFMVLSNIYTTIGYFLHERLWARIGWGLKAG